MESGKTGAWNGRTATAFGAPRTEHGKVWRSRLALGAPLGALAFWAYCVIQHSITGPLNVDEIYFSHVLWLVSRGRQMYVDFYCNHLPTYFMLLKPLVSAFTQAPWNLGFVWAVRGLSAAILAAYLLVGWALHRALPHRDRSALIATCSLLLLFAVLARMLEIRADTFGLILLNIAWAIALSSATRPRLLWAGLFAGLSVLFSARAGIMGLVAGACLLYVALRMRDMRAFSGLLLIACGFLAGFAALYLLDPAWMTLVVRSTFLEAAKFAPDVPLARRAMQLDRAVLCVAIVAALVSGWRMSKSGQPARGAVVLGASAGQLLLVFADPAPYQYVYGWAAVPVVFGVVHLSRSFATLLPVGAALLFTPPVYPYVAASPFAPPLGTVFSATFDPVLSEGELQKVGTPEVVRMMLTGERQADLQSQLRVRAEVCRRIEASVVVPWKFHPVCLPDALYDWAGVHWPDPAHSAAETSIKWSTDQFARAVASSRPALFVWQQRSDRPPALSRDLRNRLDPCYHLFDGFALLNPPKCGDAEATQTPEERPRP